ncbi:hypothetical protein FKP32DRAFT_1588335 [Trametes sanguinea]|nr:hypothetical protein FKP32DRAFT_1588335 [Trametes sanguinea]
MAMNAESNALRVLDDDCLQLIFSELRTGRGLRSLSLTCSWLRESCLNVLFEKSIAFVNSLEDPTQSFPPPHLWRHVRTLKMFRSFEYRMRRSSSGEMVADAVCNKVVLSQVLHQMSNLTSLIFMDEEEYGIPWPILQVILSTPQLRSFDLFGRLSIADDAPSKPTLNLSPITSFRYVPQDERKGQRSSPSEKRILGAILQKLAPTLQALHLPCESVPFRKLDLWDWPGLQELYLRGDGRRLAKAGAPLVSILRRMPRLRRLSLKLARCNGQRPLGPIWPPNSLIAMPWPELESLTLSWIHPHEQLFGHLPATFRDLHLRAWPRHYYLYMRPLWARGETPDEAGPSWASDILTPSSLMRAIQHCRVSTLECLELEFERDVDDIAMLRSIAQSFPNLRSLQLFRYRPEEDLSAVPSELICEALSPLHDLRTLRLFLDFQHLKRSNLRARRRRINTPAVGDLMNSAMRLFACRSPSLQFIQMFLIGRESYWWKEFQVARDAAGGPLVSYCDAYVPAHNVNDVADCE